MKPHLTFSKDDAIYLERELCNEAGSIQDQLAASFGGFNRINFSRDGYSVNSVIISLERKKDLNDHLMLFFTGFSSDIQKGTEKSMKDKPQQLIEMSHLVDDAEKILTDKNTSLNEFGKLLGGKHMIIALLAHLVSHLKINVENSAKVC